MVGTTAIRILSAGAPKAGVRRCAEAHETETGLVFQVDFATAPKIRERVRTGKADADLIVAPDAALSDFAASGQVVADTILSLGSVEAGVAVRNGTQEPDLSSADALREALLAADVVIYNRASSGQYIETMIEGLGVAERIADKTVRTDSGSQAMERLASDTTDRPIAFGQITEIRLQEDLGIHLVGPLPAEIGKRTHYSVGLSSAAADPDAGKSLLNFFASDAGRRILSDTGVI